MSEQFTGVGADGKRECRLPGCRERFFPHRQKHFYCSAVHRYKGNKRLAGIRLEKNSKLKARIAELERELEQVRPSDKSYE